MFSSESNKIISYSNLQTFCFYDLFFFVLFPKFVVEWILTYLTQPNFSPQNATVVWSRWNTTWIPWIPIWLHWFFISKYTKTATTHKKCVTFFCHSIFPYQPAMEFTTARKVKTWITNPCLVGPIVWCRSLYSKNIWILSSESGFSWRIGETTSENLRSIPSSSKRATQPSKKGLLLFLAFCSSGLWKETSIYPPCRTLWN